MADLRVEHHGSIALLRPLTDAGQRWLEEAVDAESWQWYGGALAVEPRYLSNLTLNAVNDGMVVE